MNATSPLQTKDVFSAIIRGFMETNTPPFLQWNMPVQPHFERGHQWYLIAGTIVLAVAAYGIITNSWPLAVVSILCGGLYFILRDHTPRETTAALYEKGVLYDGSFHQWDEFVGFWILETPVYTQLRLCNRNKRKPDVAILMNGVSIDDMTLACGTFLPELTDRKETLIDIFSRLAKL